MTKIPSISRTSPSRGAGKAGKAKRASQGTAFSDHFPSSDKIDESAPVEDIGRAEKAESVSHLLALQEIERPSPADRKAKRHGNDILDGLRELQLRILSGFVSPDQLEEIARRVQNRPAQISAEMSQLLDQIELRARIELAKQGRGRSG